MKITEQANGRIEVREFEGLKVRAAYGKTPHSSADGTLLRQLRVLEKAAEHYDGEVARARANKHLSLEGVRESTRGHRARLADSLAVLRANANSARQKALENREALFAVPQLDPADAAGAALDREIREGFLSLSDLQRPLELAKERNLHALLRSPFETVHSKAALSIWRQRVKDDHGPEIGKFEQDAENATWFLSVAHAYTSVLTNTEAELGTAARGSSASTPAASRAAQTDGPTGRNQPSPNQGTVR